MPQRNLNIHIYTAFQGHQLKRQENQEATVVLLVAASASKFMATIGGNSRALLLGSPPTVFATQSTIFFHPMQLFCLL
jgi:hypothetical protein